MGTEAHMLLPDTINNDDKWSIYLAMSEAVKACLCLLLVASVSYRLRPAMLMGAVWFTTQAQQELMGMNDGTTETWEYWLVAVMTIAIAIQLTLTRK